MVLELHTPEILLWTGHRVAGTEQGGIVFCRWQGQNYSLDAPGYRSDVAARNLRDLHGGPSDGG